MNLLRETYGDFATHGPPSRLLPELPMVGWTRFPAAKVQGLAPHVHQAWEICCIVDGCLQWFVGNERHEVRRGSLFWTAPGEPHGGADTVMHPCELLWAQIEIGPGALPGLTDEATNEIRRNLQGLPLRSFPAPAAVSAHFAALLAEHRAPSALSLVAARAALHALLVDTVRACPAHAPAVSPSSSPAVAEALLFMEAHLCEPFTVRDVARRVHLGEARLHEAFVRDVGETPAQWRLRRRIEEAKRFLLTPGRAVTDIALAVGFASSQHFATAFKRVTGRTPREWRLRQTAEDAL